MKITIEPTNDFVEIGTAAFKSGADWLPTRVWKGTTERGVDCILLIMAVQPQTDDPDDLAEFYSLIPVPVPGDKPVK